MSKQKSSWGIEIGASGIKAIKLVASETGVDVENYAVIPYKQILSTPDVDGNESIRLALQELLSRNEFENSTVVASLAGALGVVRFATLPPVEPKRIPEIIKFEAAQQIPFSIEQAEWDYQVFRQADMPDVKVGVFAVAKDRMIEFMGNINASDIRLEALTLSPLAVFNAFSFDEKLAESPQCTAYIDIGTMSTDVIIVEDNIPWVRTFPIGGHHLTEALVKQLKISYSRAEEEKVELSTSKMGKQMLQAMRGVVLDLAQEISRSITYYQQLNRGSEIKRIIGVGATFKLPNLTKSLSQGLPAEIQRLEQFQRLEISGRHGSKLVQYSMEMATAYGLALQGLDIGRVQANLLPRQLMLERLWGGKKWWFAGMAGVMAASAAITGMSWFRAESDVINVSKDRALDKQIIEAQGYVDDMKKIVDEDPRAMSETLIRTKTYRDLYPRIMEDIGAALATIKPADILVSNEPDSVAIMALPPGQINRLYVRKIDLAYVPPQPVAGTAPTDVAGSFGLSQANPPFANPGAYKPSKIVVTIQGYSYLESSQASALIKDTIAKWLGDEQARLAGKLKDWKAYQQQNADDSNVPPNLKSQHDREMAQKYPDRPYLIGFDLNTLFYSETSQAKDAAASIVPAAPGKTGMTQIPLSDLLRERPVVGDGQTHDFRLTWEFVLLGPEDARKVLLAEGNQKKSRVPNAADKIK